MQEHIMGCIEKILQGIVMKTWKQQLEQAGYPTAALVLDFETYWGKDYTLSKMSTIEYVTNPQFELTGLGYQYIGKNSIFLPPKEIEKFLEYISRDADGCSQYTIIGQNLKFDCLILARQFGIFPRYTVDTKDLDRIWDARDSHKLAHMAKKWDSPKPKGVTKQFEGLHWADMSGEKRQQLAEYTKTDVEIEADLFQKLLPLVPNPEIELRLATQTLQMYLKPQIEIDIEMGLDLKDKMRLEMLKPLEDLREVGLDCSHEDISGNIKFVELLNQELSENEQVPMKMGKNKMIPALAREDEGLRYLLSHDKENVRLLANARLSIKSWPLHIKRVDNLINQATCSDGLIGAPLSYYAGHLGRWGGTEKINLQNLGGRGRGQPVHSLIGQIRHLLKAPNGFVFGVSDFSQIEARVLAWLAGQNDLVQIFANGGSPYSNLASEIFQEPVRKPKDSDSEDVRKDLAVKYGFGKDGILGCIGCGSKIFTKWGYKNIEDITLQDEVWDGYKWVQHQGIAYQGKKKCVQIGKVWLTPEHEILLLDGWTTAAELNMNNRQLEKNMGILLLPKLNEGQQEELSPSNVVAPVVDKLLHQETIWSLENLHAVVSVLKRHPAKLRAIRHLYHRPINNNFLIEFVRSLADVKQNHIEDMVKEVLECGPIGSKIESLFLTIWQRYRGGIIRNLTSTELTMIGDMNLTISDSLPNLKTLETADILYSGNHRRFQTESFVVSNCGYGMGTNKFYTRCRENEDLRPLFDSGKYDWDFVDKLIKTYRAKYAMIPQFWQTVEKAWKFVTNYTKEIVELPKNLKFWHENGATFIGLPSGRFIRYPYASINKRGDLLYRWGKLWGGSITENIVQAVARDLLAESLLRLADARYNLLLTVHDEIIALLNNSTAELWLQGMIDVMCMQPKWAEGLPLAAEGKIVKRYEK